MKDYWGRVVKSRPSYRIVYKTSSYKLSNYVNVKKKWLDLQSKPIF